MMRMAVWVVPPWALSGVGWRSREVEARGEAERAVGVEAAAALAVRLRALDLRDWLGRR